MPEEIATEEILTDAPIGIADSFRAAEDELFQASGETKTEDTVAKTDESDKKDNSDLTSDEQAAARNLYRALKNPESAKQTIQALANSIGLTGNETPKQVEKVAESMLDIFKESLGPEFDFLAEKIGPAVEKIINKTVIEKTKDIRDKISQDEQFKLQTEADTTIANLSQRYFDTSELPKDFESKMSKLMDNFQPSGKMTPKEYVESIFYMVAGEQEITPKTKEVVRRMERASSDVSSRLNSRGVSSPVGASKLPTKMSLKDSIAAALTEIES